MLPSIFNKELLGYHRCNDSLAKTHNISKKETIITYQLLIAFNHSIRLIIVSCISLRHIKGVSIICCENTIREIFHQHFDIQLVRRYVTFQISTSHSIFQISSLNGHAF